MIKWFFRYLNMKNVSFIILAAGKSKRMKSNKSKVLHSLGDRPLLNFVYDIAKKNSSSKINFVCSDEVKHYVEMNFSNSKTIIQKKRLGTAHAVETAEKLIPNLNQDIIVLFGDVPLIKDSTIKKLIRSKNKSKSIGSVVAFMTKKPFGYGRIILENNFIKSIIEEKDASLGQKNIKLCNSGILICDAKYLFKSIKKILNKNNQKERFLTDICKIAYDDKKPFTFIRCSEIEASGINSPKQLIDLDSEFQKTYKNKLIENGVGLIQPETIRICYGTKIGKNVIIEPHVIIKKNVIVKDGTKILSGSYLEECTVGKNCSIGPYARIRPGTMINNNVKIGNFVEVKNSFIGNFSSISHLSYIGDSLIGKNVNIGAGTITCNYDGFKKNKTIIDDGVFIGSNCSLIAPLKIAKKSIVGAGSVLNKNVPASSLAIERAKLLIKKRKNKGK